MMTNFSPQYSIKITVNDLGERDKVLFKINLSQNNNQVLHVEFPCQIQSDPWQSIFDSDNDKNKEVLSLFNRALESIKGREQNYVRLLVETDSERTYNWCWEKITRPGDNVPLSLRKQVEFARVLPGEKKDSSPKKENVWPSILSVLASDEELLTSYNLPLLANPNSISSFRDLFGSNDLLYYLMTDMKMKPVTLKRILERVETGRYNILHLRAHGILPSEGNDTLLRLGIVADDQGDIHLPVTLNDIENALEEISARCLPLLVILDTCFSEKKEDYWPFYSLGSSFLKLGVPSTVTMASAILTDEADTFHQAFYQELTRGSGVVGLAVTEGRRALYEKYGDRAVASGLPIWAIPIFQVNNQDIEVNFLSGLLEKYEVKTSNGKKMLFSSASRRVEGRIGNYIEYQVTDPPISSELSEYLLDRVNKFPPIPRNYLIIHGKNQFGKTTLLYKMLHKQVRFFEARTLDRLPIYIDIKDVKTELLSNEDWEALIVGEIAKFFSLPNENSFTFSEEPRKLILLDNIDCLSVESLQALNRFITSQLAQYFVITCNSNFISSLEGFAVKGNIFELKGLPSIDDLPKENKLRRFLKGNEELKEITKCPLIYLEFQEIIEEFSKTNEPFFHYKLIERWLKRRIRKFSGIISNDVILNIIVKLAYDMSLGSPTKGLEHKHIIKTIVDEGGPEDKTNIILSMLVDENFLEEKLDVAQFYVFANPVLHSYLLACHLNRKISLLKPEETLSFVSMCNSDDLINHGALEFLVEMLPVMSSSKVIHEQIIIDAVRSGKHLLAARLLESKGDPIKAGYILDEKVAVFAFLVLLQDFALGGTSVRQQFIDWMKVESVTERIPKNFLIRCKPDSLRVLKELLISNEPRDSFVALRLMNWIVSDQCVPLLLENPTKYEKLYSEILDFHRDWLENGIVAWLKKLSPSNLETVLVRLKQMEDRQELDRGFFITLNRLFTEQ